MIETKAQTSAQLDINNINARVNTAYKPLFYDTGSSDRFEAPKGSGKNTIFASNLWIGGFDSLNSLHLASEIYGSDVDFIPGPIMDSIHYASQISQWNRVWKIDRYDVLNHIAFYNQTGYTIPQVFLDWPAHGNTSLGQANDLAPYFDINNNGLYEPINGDYPMVPGDQCVYYIFNDDTIHTESGGKKLGVEIHAFVYSFNCPTDSALMNTVFVKYKIINRSQQTFNNAIFGIWSDLDIGGSIDDFVGCNLQNGSYYGYNGDNFDDGVYENYLASQSITILAGPYADVDNLDNPITNHTQNAIDSSGIPYAGLGMNYEDGIIDNERLGLSNFAYYNMGSGPNGNGNPQIPSSYYNMMSGYWEDASHFVYGGNAHYTSPSAISSGLIETDYVFPGDSDPLFWATNGISANPQNWNEIDENNPIGDMRTIGSMGPFTFLPGSIHEIDLAFVFAQEYVIPNNPTSPISIMNERIDSVRNYFSNNITPCGNSFFSYLSANEKPIKKAEFSIYPNPSSNYFTLDFESEFQNLNYSIHDILGKEILSGKINSSQTTIDCENWSSGVYLIKVGNENGYRVEKLIVKK